jgi:hypothetical protein
MLQLSKVFVRGIPIAFTLVILALAGGITSLQATPICSSTITLAGGDGTIPNTMLGAGVCVQSQDKLYGTFNFGNLPSTGSVTFGFSTVAGVDRHSITFSDSLSPSETYTESFEVSVIQGGGFPSGNSISAMSADVTQTIGGPTTLVQTTTPTPASGSINLSKNADVVTGPFQVSFTSAQNVTDMVVMTTFTTGPNSDASAILDTILQTQQVVPTPTPTPQPTSTPEPASLELLGIALTGLGALGLRRKS